MADTEKLIETLASLCTLSLAFKQALRTELKAVSYPKHYMLVQIDTVAHHSYYMCKGFAVGYFYQDKKKIVTRFFREGDIIVAPQSFCRQSQSEVAIQVTEDSELLSCSHSATMRLYEKFIEANELARLISAEFHTMTEKRIMDLQNLSAWDRYAYLISHYPGIELRASQDIIASYLSITPQSLSRLKRIKNK